LLLDTHALLWWWLGSKRLGAGASAAIGDRKNEVLASVASAWEIELKRALGKLRWDGSFRAELAAEGFALLDLRLAHVESLRRLPPHHRDPFDRILLAQAMHEEAVLVSGDATLARYGVPLLW
jgi:PIN domain nuclease of toxin-antitoxin system